MYKLNGIPIKTPPEFEIEHYNITKADRNAEGYMIMELVAKKQKFLLTYPVLSKDELDTILNIIDSSEVFFTFEYPDNGIIKSATVYSGPIRRRRFRTHMGWYWKDVTFNLIER